MVRVALLGAGMMGKVHAEAWKQVRNAKVVAVADGRADRARDLAGAMGAEPSDSLDQTIRRDDIDAVDICLPTDLHEECSLKALRAGKSALCEKPLALTLESADRILQAAKASGKVFMVAQVVRFWPQYKTAAEIIRRGELGKVLTMRLSRTSKRPDWGEWFQNPQKTGGALFDLNVHDLDYVVSILGRPRRIHAIGIKGDRGGWDYVSTHLDFGTANAEVESGYLFPPSYPFTTRLRALCQKGVLEYDFRVAGNVESRGEEGSLLTLMAADGSVSTPAVEPLDAYVGEILHFTQCVERARESDMVPNEQVRLVLEVVLAIRRSLESGKIVDL